MLIKSLIDNENGTKLEIYKNGENNYGYKHYEFFTNIGWRFMFEENNYSKDAIEFEFDIKVA